MATFTLNSSITYATGNTSLVGNQYNMDYSHGNFFGAFFGITISANNTMNLSGIGTFPLAGIPPGIILTNLQTANFLWIPFGFILSGLYQMTGHHAGAISAAGQKSVFALSGSTGSASFTVPDNTSLFILLAMLIDWSFPATIQNANPPGLLSLAIPQGAFQYQGNYAVAINSSKWQITNLTRPGSPNYFPGDQAKIFTPDNSYDFSTVTRVTVAGVVFNTFTSQTPAAIIITLPTAPVPPTGNQPVTIINPTQFSGEATLGFINILVANSSGIYKITPGKTHDTTYVTVGSNLTQNTAIPNPFIKTGFIGG